MIPLADDPVGLQLLRFATWQPDRAGLEALHPAQWNELLDRSGHFRLAPLVAHQLAGLGLALPDPVRARLARLAREHAFLSLAQDQELANLAKLFGVAGLAFVALKGAALAHCHYPHAALRPMRDLDLLMAPGDAAEGYRILRERGYAIPGEVITRPVEQVHEYPLLRSPLTGAQVELHHGLMSSGWVEGDDLARAMLASERTMLCRGQKVAIPTGEQLLVHLLAHATMNRPFDVGPQFLADLRMLDTGAIRREILARYGVERAWLLARAMGERIGGGAGPVKLAAEADAALALLLLSDEQERERKLLIRSGGDRVSKAWAIRRLLAPPPDALAQISGRPAGDWRNLAAYPRWLAQRTARFRKARGSHDLRGDVAAALRLSEWLAADGEPEI